MIEILPESEGKVLGIRATGRVTNEDYEKVFIPRLKKIIAEHGAVSCLYYMDAEFQGWEVGAMWDDAKFGIKHAKDFDKIAVVGGPKWAAWGVKLEALFMKGEIKIYSVDQLSEAWNWIKS